jgi:hypothetical protein
MADKELRPMTADFPGLVDLALDEEGRIVFLTRQEDGTLSVEPEAGNGTLIPPERRALPFALPKAEKVKEWHKRDDSRLFKDVLSYLKRFSYLPDGAWLIVASAIFLTYLQDHSGVRHLPMVLFYAVPERGKSKTGKAATLVSYRGIHLVDIREAHLFRYAGHFKATLFFDCMHLWRNAQRNGAEDIFLLRFEKGITVSRVLYPEKGAFRDMEHYTVYGPTFMATNEPVHFILGTRCIPIIMPNRPGDYEDPTVEKAQELKERLTAWRAKNMDKPLPTVRPVKGLISRLWDISKPLLQVCQVACPESMDDLIRALLDVAGERMEDRRASDEGRIVAALSELSPPGVPKWELKTADILDYLNQGKPEDQRYGSRWLGGQLNALGLPKKKVHGGVTARLLDRETLDNLRLQYGLSGICENNSPVSPYSPDVEKSTGYAGNSGEFGETPPESRPGRAG